METDIIASLYRELMDDPEAPASIDEHSDGEAKKSCCWERASLSGIG